MENIISVHKIDFKISYNNNEADLLCCPLFLLNVEN